ncbi:MAG: PglZ domain-containing protein [Anaerolineae bacterium]|nr:PglZ domain-containing protein [Anaerolineae bacterium]
MTVESISTLLRQAQDKSLGDNWGTDLTPALATPPTITEIGMAALLPGAEKGLVIKATDKGKLTVAVAGNTLGTRQERLAHFQESVGKKEVAFAKLDQLAPLSDPHLSRELETADVVLVTATEEIDGLCESNPALARRMLDDVLNQLRRGIKTLFGLGIQAAVISADHGYLFGEKLTPGQGIDAPGGERAVLKRRVWIGQGGADLPGVLRAPLSAFGIGGNLEIATPQNLSCFKVKGGAMEYFHGGLSLPELVIPVLTVRPTTVFTPTAAANIQWTLTLGSQTISTRFLSVTIEGRSTELLPIEPPAIRVEVRVGASPISIPISASYGFQEATKDVQLALDADAPQTMVKNTVTLMITEMPAVDEVTIHLLDASTGISLARLDHAPFAITL